MKTSCPEENKEFVGRKIREIRESRAMSQKNLAISAEISQSTLSEIEYGKYTIKYDVLCRICDALKVTPNDVLGYCKDDQTKRAQYLITRMSSTLREFSELLGRM